MTLSSRQAVTAMIVHEVMTLCTLSPFGTVGILVKTHPVRGLRPRETGTGRWSLGNNGHYGVGISLLALELKPAPYEYYCPPALHYYGCLTFQAALPVTRMVFSPVCLTHRQISLPEGSLHCHALPCLTLLALLASQVGPNTAIILTSYFWSNR